MRILDCAICTFILVTFSTTIFYFYLIFGHYVKSKTYMVYLDGQTLDEFAYNPVMDNGIRSLNKNGEKQLEINLKQKIDHFMKNLWSKLKSLEKRKFYERSNASNYNVTWKRNTSIKSPSLERLCNVTFCTLTKDDQLNIDIISQYFPSMTFIESIRQRIPEINSCAIVTSSGSLLGSRKGREIDSHDVVIRFNNAPTIGYEEDVGNKTSIRILNSQVVANSTFNISDNLYSSSINFVWDPSDYNCNLDKWFESPDHEFFSKYVDSRSLYPNVPFYIIHPKVIWSLWDLLQESTENEINKNPPSSGFIGFLLAVHLCTNVFGYEYIPSIRLTKTCHYYSKIKNVECTFGNWHSLSTEKIYLLQLNSGSNYDLVINGKLKITGCNDNFYCI